MCATQIDLRSQFDMVQFYRGFGLQCLPVEMRHKGPPLFEWKKYQIEPPSDAEFQTWFPHDYIDNIAVLCGSVSDNLVVLDFDDMQFFSRFWDEDKLKELPVVETGSGKRHVWVKSDKPVRSFSIPQLKLDVRAEGQYVIAPYSYHPSGGQYRFLNGFNKIPIMKDIVNSIWCKAEELGVKRKSSYEILNLTGPTKEIENLEKLVEKMPPAVRKDWEYGRPKPNRSDAYFHVMTWFIQNNVPLSQLTPLFIDWDLRTEMNKLKNRSPEKYIELTYTNALNALPSLVKVHETFKKWLYLGDDLEIIDVILAAACDQKIAGDPVWLWTIGNPGGTKTELLNSLEDWDTYTLDSLTPRTLVSGKVTKEEGPIRGVLAELNGKVLVIKDFTVILAKRPDDRDEIFSQLRAMYDGKYEAAFGNFPKPITIEAHFGLIAAVTPIIEIYTKLQTILGERFLKIRHFPDRKKATLRAEANQGKEDLMREELRESVKEYLKSVDFTKEIKFTEEQLEIIRNLALFLAKGRAYVHTKTYKGEIVEMSEPVIEYATRLVKQLKKLIKLIAIVRGKTETTEEEIDTIRRIVKDSMPQNRLKIIKWLYKQKNCFTSDYYTDTIATGTKIPASTARRCLEKMAAIGLVEENWRLSKNLSTQLEYLFPSITGRGV